MVDRVDDLEVSLERHGADATQHRDTGVTMNDATLRACLDADAGASVRLYACRCEEDRGSHYGWPRQNTDVPTEYTSDESGTIVLRYPTRFGSPENWKTLCEISMLIRHAEFIMPAVDRGRRQRVRYVCKPDQEAHVTLQMQAIAEAD